MKLKTITENRKGKKGQVMIINLLFLLITISVMIALIPQLVTLLNMAQQSDYLNCNGYKYLGDVNNTLSYNVSLPSNVLACIGINLYLPYIVLAVLIAAVSRVVLGRITTDSGI
jgi:uncharacterized membrane protein